MIKTAGKAQSFDVINNIGATTICNFAADGSGVVDLFNGMSGYTTARGAAAALTSDGAGGLRLALGIYGAARLLRRHKPHGREFQDRLTLGRERRGQAGRVDKAAPPLTASRRARSRDMRARSSFNAPVAPLSSAAACRRGRSRRGGRVSSKSEETAMTKRAEAKYKIDRRMGENIWGRPRSPFNKREYGPGQHGQRRKGKATDFGTQLKAKQKLKGYYGNISERQFHKYYVEAIRMKGDSSANLIGLLERRLDAVVYRAKFVPTVFAARQFVNHGHVSVNGRRVNIASFQVKVGDVVTIKESSRQLVDRAGGRRARRARHAGLPRGRSRPRHGEDDAGSRPHRGAVSHAYGAEPGDRVLLALILPACCKKAAAGPPFLTPRRAGKRAPMDVEFADVIASGRVQGVGYREFARRAAGTHGVAGFVRNRADGTVEARLVAAAPALEAMLADLRRGPPHGRVDRLVIVARGAAAPASGFLIQPTR